MPIGAAIGGGLGAIGSIGSSLIGANASQQAASQEVAAQQQMLAQIQGIIKPIISQGTGIVNAVNPTLQGLLTGNGSGAAGIQQTLSGLPGFQFANQWGQLATQNQGSTEGLGGNVLSAGAQYATGLANQYYGSYLGGLQGYLNSGLSTETNAANTLSGATQSALSSIGNAQAQGTLGTANAISSGITGTTSALSNAATLGILGNKLGLGGGGLLASPSYNGIYTNSNSVLSGLGS